MAESFWRIDEGGLPGCPVGTIIALVQEGDSARVMREGVGQVGMLYASTTEQTSTPDGSSITLANQVEGWRATLSRVSTPQAAGPTWPCPHCSTPQLVSTRYCANCGQPLAAASDTRPTAAAPASGMSFTRKAVLGLVGLVIVMLVINAAAGGGKPISVPPPAQPAPAALTLLNVNGSGIKNTQPFSAAGDHVTVSYAYDCSGFGGTGNFIVHLNDSTGLVAGVANELGAKGQSSSTAYFNGSQGPFHLEINSECTWNVIVVGQP